AFRNKSAQVKKKQKGFSDAGRRNDALGETDSPAMAEQDTASFDETGPANRDIDDDAVAMGKNDTPAMAEDDTVDFYEGGHDNSDINDAAPFDNLALEDLASDQNVYNSDGDMSYESNNDEWFSDNDSQTQSREVQAKQDKNVQVYENSRVVANLQNAFRLLLVLPLKQQQILAESHQRKMQDLVPVEKEEHCQVSMRTTLSETRLYVAERAQKNDQWTP
ncbi:hypothetical protein, partial, partial [Parasitella parasitica]